MKPIVLLGEARGENEDRIKSSFVGASGVELLRMLSETQIIDWTEADAGYLSRYYNTSDPQMIDCIWQLHPEVYRTNVFQLHPPQNKLEWFCGGKAQALRGYPALLKSKFVREDFLPEIDRLGDELIRIDPNLVICFGNTALWALIGRTGVSKLRGTTFVSTHTATGYKCLSTYHPAAVLRQWELRPTTLADLMKAKREAEYPEVRRPKREIWIEPEIEDIERFINEHIIGCPILSVDIETSGSRVTCIGLAPRAGLAIVIPFDDVRRKGRSYWATKELESKAWWLIRGVLGDPKIKKLFQNGAYDIAFLWRSIGIKTMGASEDSMLLHHALQPESLKGLAFLGSIYTDETSWKSQRRSETIKADA